MASSAWRVASEEKEDVRRRGAEKKKVEKSLRVAEEKNLTRKAWRRKRRATQDRETQEGGANPAHTHRKER